MTQFPNRSTGIIRIMQRARQIMAIKPSQKKEINVANSHNIPVHENQYFTFDKDGELIDLDDELIAKIEQKVQEDWQHAYLRDMKKSTND